MSTTSARTSLRRRLAPTLVVALSVTGISGISALTAAPASAGAPTISGSATNFDVPDDTGTDCEGFEVDIEDITPADVTYTWPGAPSYPNPYGPATPQEIQPKTFADGHSGVSVRFQATYANGAWSAYTPVGQVDHFGVHVTGVPGVQTYTWLCDLGGPSVGSTGLLVPYGGTTSGNYYPQPSVPSVVPTVVPTPSGEGVAPEIVPAQIPQSAEARLPDAVFVTKYRAMSASAVDVNQLVVSDPAVQAAESNSDIASTPELFQPEPGGNDGVETEPADPVRTGDQANVTVTETYQYTGPVDPADNSVTCNDIVGDPNNCTNFIGPLISRQMQSTQLTATAPRAGLDVTVHTGTVASGAGGNVTADSLPTTADPAALDCGSDGGACLVNVDDPSTVTLTATPNDGYLFQGWHGACAGTSTTCTTSVTGATAVTATFVLQVVVTSVAPADLHPGQTAKVTVLATGLTKGATLQVSGTGVSVSSVKSSTTKLTATVAVASNAPLGARDLTVRDPSGLSGVCSGCLTVYEPTITGLSPATLPAGTARAPVVLTGTGFSGKVKVTVSGTGVTVKAAVVSDSELSLSVTVAKGATAGPRDVTVTNKDGATVRAAGALTVT